MADPRSWLGPSPHLTETTLSSQTVFQGRFLHARSDRVRLPNGLEATREYIVHPGAVMVVPLLDHNRVLLERQFRYPLQRALIEFPAGKLDPGEDPWVCAQRELAEETGYRASEWARAGVLHPVIAYATEVIEVWFARGLQAGPRRLDDEEFLDLLEATPDELMDACRLGVVTDAKTLVGALWLQNVLRGDWVLDWRRADTNPSRPQSPL